MCISLIASRPMELSWEPVWKATVESQQWVDQYSWEPDWLKLDIYREQLDLRTSIRLGALAGRGVVQKKKQLQTAPLIPSHTVQHVFFFRGGETCT